MAIFVAAGLVGVFGRGWLSAAVVSTADDSLRLEYERTGRVSAPIRLRVLLRHAVDGGDKVRFWLSRDYLDGVQLQQISPVPERTEIGADRVVYTFAAAKRSPSTVILFYVEPEKAGLQTALAGGADEQIVTFTQLIYP
jgi:hypothetical protein